MAQGFAPVISVNWTGPRLFCVFDRVVIMGM